MPITCSPSVRRLLAATGTLSIVGAAVGAAALSQNEVAPAEINVPASNLSAPAVDQTSTASTVGRLRNPAFKAIPISVASDELIRAFPILAQAGGAAMPTALAAKLAAGPWMAKFQPNYHLGRLLSQKGTKPEVWLVPGDDSVCLHLVYSEDDGGSTCQTRADVMLGHATITRSSSTGTATYGIAPKQVREVRAHHGDGTSEVLAVRDGLFVAPDSSNVTYIDDGG